jgi:hypothetical protein
MATITPVSAFTNNVRTATWTGITTTTDTPEAFGPINTGRGPVYGAVTFSGTFNGGTTAVLQGSIDGVVYATLTDIAGNAISATAAKMQEFVSSAMYFKPSVGSGVTDDVNVVVIFRY